MNKRTLRTIIIIAIIILLLLIIAFFLFMYKFPGAAIPKSVNQTAGQTVNNQKTLVTASTTPAVPAKQTKAAPASNDTITQTNLVKIAESFAERLGSYSNQSNFSNITELKLYMTPSMRAWADSYIAANQKAAYSGVYQGVTTHAISAETQDFDNTKGQADILVHTQKVSQTGTAGPVISYQDIVVTFVKQGNNWLVDNAVWKK
ncbi:MAG TPA: hypothetical protein VMC41_02575 [Candidatus Nanoarchaeia archaeon]|nr:hypothetical protein [Candidatus Nanoarchaeia archaeon]